MLESTTDMTRTLIPARTPAIASLAALALALTAGAAAADSPETAISPQYHGAERGRGGGGDRRRGGLCGGPGGAGPPQLSSRSSIKQLLAMRFVPWWHNPKPDHFCL